MIHTTLKTKITLLLLLACNFAFAQIVERERPKEWDELVNGARFVDRFLPMKGEVLSSDTWGGKNVIPRYIDNGIEDNIWSYWGGNILKGDDNKYHLFVCGWLECSEKGHMEWDNSYTFHTVSDNLTGPFKLKNMIGKGHNPEAFRVRDGRYVLYVIDGRYVADNINGKWEYGKFDFDPRDRRIIEGLSNLSFAQREDGSYVMVCRGGGIWISQNGLSCYNQLTDKRVYPNVDGEFEDPVIWKDHIQYHMIVNDWLGRIAFYLRSKDGVEWVVDPGEAYTPGIAVHEDGTVEDWFKFERLKIFQDEYGRAVQANFAVIDTLKYEDKPNDNHSSKNIGIPLNPGVLLTVMNSKPINSKTKTIEVKIMAEEGFNPQKDINIASLRFGASPEVNFGRGSKALSSFKEGNDLVVVFDGKGNGITEKEFAPKLIGKTKQNKLIYGYARLPYIDYIEPILSARAPVFTKENGKTICNVKVENFGQISSPETLIKVEYLINNEWKTLTSGNIPALQPYEGNNIKLNVTKNLNEEKYRMRIVIYSKQKKTLSVFEVQEEITVKS